MLDSAFQYTFEIQAAQKQRRAPFLRKPDSERDLQLVHLFESCSCREHEHQLLFFAIMWNVQLMLTPDQGQLHDVGDMFP